MTTPANDLLPDGVLRPDERRIANRVLDEEEGKRRHFVISLSGAHTYGFASPDSDLDLKGIHVLPTSALVGLVPPREDAMRMEIVEGVEIDYSSNELGGALRGILKGNGNYIERVLGRLVLRGSRELEELKPLAVKSLSKRIHFHYRGFATSQLAEWDKGGGRSAKKALYVLRTTLTGTHALATGEVITDLRDLMDAHGFGGARELIQVKLSAEKAAMPDDMSERWRSELARAFTVLDEAAAKSPLPQEPPNLGDVSAWLVEVRRRNFHD